MQSSKELGLCILGLHIYGSLNHDVKPQWQYGRGLIFSLASTLHMKHGTSLELVPWTDHLSSAWQGLGKVMYFNLCVCVFHKWNFPVQTS